jgi:hypothetical protein
VVATPDSMHVNESHPREAGPRRQHLETQSQITKIGTTLKVADGVWTVFWLCPVHGEAKVVFKLGRE